MGNMTNEVVIYDDGCGGDNDDNDDDDGDNCETHLSGIVRLCSRQDMHIGTLP